MTHTVDGGQLHGGQAREAGPPREAHRLRVHPRRHGDHHDPAPPAQSLPVHPAIHDPHLRHGNRKRHDCHHSRHEAQLQQDVKTHKNLVSSERLALLAACFFPLIIAPIISIGYVLVGIEVPVPIKKHENFKLEIIFTHE